MKFPTLLIVSLIVLSVNVVSQNAGKAAEAYNRGLQLQDAGDYDNAMIAYDSAIAANPRMADAYNNRANIKLLRGDQNGAIVDFSKVIEISPTYPPAITTGEMSILKKVRTMRPFVIFRK